LSARFRGINFGLLPLRRFVFRSWKSPSLRYSRLAAALAALSILAGCSGYSQPAPPGTVNFLIEAAPINLDPRFASDAQSQNLDGLIFSSLVAHDDKMNVIPDLARSWDNPDPLTFIFHLKPGVKFHDGRPLTSADVKYTFDTVLSGTPSPTGMVRSIKRSSFDKIASIDAPDPLTVIFHLREPRASFLWDMVRPGIGIVPNGSGTEIKLHPVGTGPFRFVSMVADEEVDLDRDPDYFRGASDPPDASGGMPVEHVHFRVVPDAIVRALELRKGSADIGGVNSLPPDMVVALGREPDLAVADEPGTALSYVSFNMSDPLIAHREVRQALDYATDRATIIRYLYRGEARIATGQLPPNHWALDPSIAPHPYDPAEAEKLLDAAGFPRGTDGVRLHLTLKSSTDETARLLGETLADQWKKVGVALDVRPLETATMFADIVHGSFQMYTFRWLGVDNDPSFFEFAFSSANMPPNGANRGHYSDPALDALIAKERVEMDHEKRKALDWQMQQVIANDEPYLNLWFNDTVCVYRTRVTNVRPDPAGDYNFLENVRVK
jgi:peptide/nickel transport system substrate-binding protein